MERPAITGLATSAKLDAETPEATVVPTGRETVSAAPSRFASVSGEGCAGHGDGEAQGVRVAR